MLFLKGFMILWLRNFVRGNAPMCNCCQILSILISCVANSPGMTAWVSIEDKFSDLHSGLFSLSDICRLYWQLSSQLQQHKHTSILCSVRQPHRKNTQAHTRRDKWPKPPAAAHTTVMVWTFKKNSDKIKTQNLIRYTRQQRSQPWWLNNDTKSLSLTPTTQKPHHKPNKQQNKQDESRNTVTHIVHVDIGVCACCYKRNGWLVCIQQV